MFKNFSNFIMILILLALHQPQVCNTQYFLPQNRPYSGSLSGASSAATKRQLQLGGLGLSHGIANSQSVTQSNGGFRNGGTTSVANTRSRSAGFNLGDLEIGSTLTASNTRTNADGSTGLSHDLNVGGLGVGSSLSRDNLQNGFGLQHSPNGGVKLGLGLLNFDLSRKPYQQNSHALTQSQAQAQGRDAFARSNSNAHTFSRSFGGLGFTTTQSHSNALSGSRYGQSSARAGGLTDTAPGHGFVFHRTRRSAEHANPNNKNVKPKRRIKFLPYAYPGSDLSDFGGRQKRSSNSQATANNQNDNFEQQTTTNTHSSQNINENGVYNNNGASSSGSNLATNENSGQLSSANINTDNSLTQEGLQGTNNAQSLALNFYENQAVNANAATNRFETEKGERTEACDDGQATDNNEYGTSSQIANTNAQDYDEGEMRGSQADSSSQSILQGAEEQTSAAHNNVHANLVQDADASVINTASSHASAASRGEQRDSAVATGSAASGPGFEGDNLLSNANHFGDLFGFDGTQTSSEDFSNFNGVRDFASGGRSARQAAAFQIRKRKWASLNTRWWPQQHNQTTSSSSSSSLSGLEIINDSKEINWPKNRIQLYNHYPQQQRQPQLPQQRKQQSPQQQQQQQRQQQVHYSSINPNSSTEQFAVIDGNERHGRTFTFITDLINSLTQPTCIYPCTLEAYQSNRCCETAVLLPTPPAPPNLCCTPSQIPPSSRRPPIIVRPAGVLPPSALQPLPAPTFPLLPTQCCLFCPAYGFYGPSPCTLYTYPGGGSGYFPFVTG